jgi:hypothetical protein
MAETTTHPDRTPPARSGDPAPQPQVAGPKLYGSLVGAVRQSVPPRPVDKAFADGTDALIVRDKIVLTAVTVGTPISLGLVGWDAIIEPVTSVTTYGALGAGVTFSLGDVTFPNALANGVPASSAGNTGIVSASWPNIYVPLWQQLGYASLAAAQAVGPKCELLMTIGGAAASGPVAWVIQGAPRI